MTPTPIQITTQGVAVITQAFIRAQSETVAALMGNMQTKDCTVAAIGGDDGVPMLAISAPGYNGQAWTEVIFPEWKGWEVWCAEIARYTLTLCLVKP